ncbi:hypothetical protein P6166_04725 [Stenotrophomonas sp. HITSZ_GD]|uniref:hypothetical protein n=1 Tax=Stenotrophomonas sp. HITSZ_GD TaxID=3037248 RepID=UPI00240E8680|nr:hypothetical protein [Stenotrophomonas sp. HITSZ_GD]MDG2524662.1 hypothetical protein [Stenotrophomonas sp. HITSZ_GD]
MDLIRLLRSLEEFLYELVGWLVFYPRTLWRILCHPGQIARYTHEELSKPLESRFQETISPVLMLILTVALAHALELSLKMPLPKIESPVGQVLFGTEEGLILTRSAIFCVYALGAALGTLRRQRSRVTRDTLREPFSIQAFVACPFVLGLAVSEYMIRWPTGNWSMWGVALQLASVTWYLWARTSAFRALNQASWLRAFGLVLASFLITTAAILIVAAFFVV